MGENIPTHVIFVAGWIKKGDKYLLAQRHLDDDQAAGQWSPPGGKVEKNPNQAHIIEQELVKEIREEVGVEIDITSIKYVGSQSFIRSSGHHVVGVHFLVKYESGEPAPLEDQAQVAWMSIGQVRGLIEEGEMPQALEVIVDQLGS